MSRPLRALLLSVVLVALPAAAPAATGDGTSPAEQQFIYELNLMRRFPAQYDLTSASTFPLAVNGNLAAAARYKGEYIAGPNNGVCTHTMPEWSNRIAVDFGFPLPWWWSLDENYIEATWCSSGQTAIPLPTVFTDSTSPAHRELSLGEGGYANYREVGVGYGIVTTPDDDSTGLSLMVGARDGYDQTPPTSPKFITGVVFDDLNRNGVMDLGEGMANVTVTIGSTSVRTNAGGGYSVELSGTATGTIRAGADGAGSGSVTLGASNIEIDFVKGRSAPIIRGDQSADRWAGQDRFRTAVAISQQTHPGGADTVYLALGMNFPDGIAAGPSATAENAPILLTFTNSLPPATATELARLDPSTVVVVGGSAAIADSVIDEIESLLPSTSVDRRGGANRFETSVALSQAVFGTSTSTVYVTTGLDFPDALAAAPAAIHDGVPLLLVANDTLPRSVAVELDRLSPDTIIVMGGRSAVRDTVIDALRNHAPTVTRIDGANRYVTAAAVSAASFGSPTDTVFVAVGSNYPDALAGGAASGVFGGPVLLVPTGGVTAAVHAELLRLAPSRIIILGGTTVIPTELAEELSLYVS